MALMAHNGNDTGGLHEPCQILKKCSLVAPRLTDCLGCRRRIRGLERIQNAGVWRAYAARRKKLLPKGWRELLMFHGTAKQSLASITKTGFITAFHCNSTLWFARDCSTSMYYSAKANGPTLRQASRCGSIQAMMAEPSFITDGHAMLLCRVLVSPHILSAARVAHHVDINVIVTINNNADAYPEYILHFDQRQNF